jgi:hypothetical protein
MKMKNEAKGSLKEFAQALMLWQASFWTFLRMQKP